MESMVWKMILAGLVFPWTLPPNHVFRIFFAEPSTICRFLLQHVSFQPPRLWIWNKFMNIDYSWIIIHNFMIINIYIYIQSTLIIINHHSSTFQRNKHPPISIDPSCRRGQVWSSWRTGRAQLMASLARQQERPGGPEPARFFRYFGGGMTLFGHHSDVIIYN